MRTLLIAFLMTLATQAGAENQEDKKKPIDLGNYIVCNGYSYDVAHNYEYEEMKFKAFSIPKILDTIGKYAERFDGRPERLSDNFITVLFERENNDIFYPFSSEKPDEMADLLKYTLINRAEPTFYFLVRGGTFSKFQFTKYSIFSNGEWIETFSEKKGTANEYQFRWVERFVRFSDGEENDFYTEEYLGFGKLRCPEELNLSQK
jgi:hypothetical protein